MKIKTRQPSINLITRVFFITNKLRHEALKTGDHGKASLVFMRRFQRSGGWWTITGRNNNHPAVSIERLVYIMVWTISALRYAESGIMERTNLEPTRFNCFCLFVFFFCIFCCCCLKRLVQEMVMNFGGHDKDVDKWVFYRDAIGVVIEKVPNTKIENWADETVAVLKFGVGLDGRKWWRSTKVASIANRPENQRLESDEMKVEVCKFRAGRSGERHEIGIDLVVRKRNSSF